ncbi:hypothetical protein DFH11DRAFT_1542641 [Phellopilus nigrolimitatus]|nr:hypothetical protein DFH11DRAFT_1542641 [Phellopilus nigrolimitatus]
MRAAVHYASGPLIDERRTKETDRAHEAHLYSIFDHRAFGRSQSSEACNSTGAPARAARAHRTRQDHTCARNTIASLSERKHNPPPLPSQNRNCAIIRTYIRAFTPGFPKDEMGAAAVIIRTVLAAENSVEIYCLRFIEDHDDDGFWAIRDLHMARDQRGSPSTAFDGTWVENISAPPRLKEPRCGLEEQENVVEAKMTRWISESNTSVRIAEVVPRERVIAPAPNSAGPHVAKPQVIQSHGQCT